MSPENVEHEVLLIEAEMQTMSGKIDSAKETYDLSIQKAVAQGFWSDSAFACEGAGCALLESQPSAKAAEYFKLAASAYSKLGSTLKTDGAQAMIQEKDHGCTVSCSA